VEPLSQIVIDLQNGRNCEDGWREVFDRFYPSLLRMFAGHQIPKEDCRDLAQEAFLTAFRSLGTLHDPTHFPGWLFAVGRNTLLNYLDRKRAKKRSAIQVACEGFADQEQVAVVEHLADNSPGVEVRLLHRELLADVLQKMPARVRRCLRLRAEGHKYREIAVIMGIAEGTVKHHLYEAKQMWPAELRSNFDDALHES
jgi:RNA polymerase sigma-70 factor (ECF subfamily)